MKNNKLFVFEFISGGGFNQSEIPSSLFCEGFAMLKTLIEDFNALEFDIHALLDYRINHLSEFLPAHRIVQVNKDDNFLIKFKEQLQETTYSFIIAPEFSNILYELTRLAIKNSSIVLSTELKGIELGTSKFQTYLFFKKKGVNTPSTYLLPFKELKLNKIQILENVCKIKGPLLIKPEDGVGAESLFYYTSPLEFEQNFKSFMEKVDDTRNHVVQEFMTGRDLSCSLIGYPKEKPLILSVNSQFISLEKNEPNSEYFGGETPTDNMKAIKQELSKYLPSLDETMFLGYYGIDFILEKNNRIHFIEINPRLTTSYVGVRNILNVNPAELVVQSKLLQEPPPFDVEHRYHSTFLRVELKNLKEFNDSRFHESILPALLKEIPEIITPPIQLQSSLNSNHFSPYSMFIATKTRNKKSSHEKIQEIFRKFKDLGLAPIMSSQYMKKFLFP
ncbi:MAG: ATP-grasp domain-containing protein [Promethearchaeota archaeon]